MLYNIHQWIRLNELYKLIESFFPILNSFSNCWPRTQKIFILINGLKPKIIQTNSEVKILLKFNCAIYQWIRVDKLYKLMESFLKISELFSN